jgi:hypothetical protein
MMGIKRRTFIKNTLIAGAGVALAPQILKAKALPVQKFGAAP